MRKLCCAFASLALAAGASAGVIYDSNGFEGPAFAVGALNGQDGWSGAGFDTGLAPEVVSGAGEQTLGAQSVKLSVPNRPNSADPAPVSYMELPLADLYAAGYTSVTVSMDIFREDDGGPENIWWYPLGANPFYGLMWDQGSPGTVLPHGFSQGAPSATLVVGRWANVTMTWDFTAGLATGMYDGNVTGSLPFTTPVEWSGWAMYLARENGDPLRGSDRAWVDNFQVTGIPEPASLLLLVAGAGLLLRRR